MKQDPEKTEWSRLYRAALRRHMARGTPASLRAGLALGDRAVALKLEPLDVAGIHAQALLALPATQNTSRSRAGARVRANRFFEETTAPIEKTHGAVQKADSAVRRLTQTLKRRTEESAVSTRQLQQGIAQRQAAEGALKQSGKDHRRLQQASDRLERRVRDRAHARLSAQERTRQMTSRELRDEIAQALLGIHLRMLALKQSATASAKSLAREVAETQRMVRQSVQKIRRMARTFGEHHEA